MSDYSARPECCTDEMLEYLDALRESGETNMWGAGEYLQAEFDMARKDASAVLFHWMHTFGERHAAQVTE